MDLIDRQTVLDQITASINQFGGRYTADQLNMWGLFTQMIKDLPSAEPVRCKDCYYCVSYNSFDKTYYCCDAFEAHAEGDLIGVSLQVDPNHYCSWAERRRG